MLISLDLHGGDHAPAEILEGAKLALEEDKSLRLAFIGLPELKEKINKFSIPADRYVFFECMSVIFMDDNPLIKKIDSSINIGLNLLKEQKVDVFISAGNTGALMGNSLLTLGRIKGIRRPGIATTIPKQNGFFVFIDSGANSDIKAPDIVQFAKMGTLFSREIYNIDKPKVGILNIGEESKKGPKAYQEAYSLLKDEKDIEFIGNVEGHTLFFSDIDVVVCDGFVGNISLKLMEGFAKFVMEYVKNSLIDNNLERNIVNKLLKDLKYRLDSSEYGAAPFLGINGITLKAHGGSDRIAIYNAIQYAKRFVNSNILNKLKEKFENE